jgi:hypothetical protein
MQQKIPLLLRMSHLVMRKYGLLGSDAAKKNHVSGTSLLKHMFGCLDSLDGGTNLKKKIRNHLMTYTVV